jgi:hypothetical protein
MPDPQPLFGDDDDARPGAAGIVVAPLDLAEDEPAMRAETGTGIRIEALDLSTDPPHVAARTSPAVVALAIAGAEHPLVAYAMLRGAELFPDLMNECEFLVRNRLGELIPLDFARLSGFGADTLTKAAGLVSTVAALDERFQRIDAKRILETLLARAKAHTGQATSILGRLSPHLSFDAGGARIQIGAVRDALMGELGVIDETADAVRRISETLRVEAAALAILKDMGDHGSMGDMLARRSSLIQLSLQESELALKQIGNIRSLAEQWIMRSDEFREVTLPALGFSRSL